MHIHRLQPEQESRPHPEPHLRHRLLAAMAPFIQSNPIPILDHPIRNLGELTVGTKEPSGCGERGEKVTEKFSIDDMQPTTHE